VRAFRDRWRADVLVIEDKGNGNALLSDLKFERATLTEDDQVACFCALYAVTPKTWVWAQCADRRRVRLV
jgi:hypothetical protein